MTPLHYTCRHFTSSHLNFTQLYFIPRHYTCQHFTSSHLNFTQLHFIPRHYTCQHFTSSHLNFTQLHFTTLSFGLTPFKFPTASFHLTSLHFTSHHYTSLTTSYSGAAYMIPTSSFKSTPSVVSDKQLFSMFLQEYVVSKACISVIKICGVLIGVNVHKRAIYVH